MAAMDIVQSKNEGKLFSWNCHRHTKEEKRATKITIRLSQGNRKATKKITNKHVPYQKRGDSLSPVGRFGIK